MMKFKIDGIPYEVFDYTTIEQYSKIYKIKDLFTDDYFAAKLISTVTPASLQDLLECPFEEISYISNYIMNNLPKPEDIKFVDRFELDGVHYGFIPNWKDMSFAEYIDIDTLITKKQEEVLDYLHVIAAIMYRPIISDKSKHDFKIEKYDFESINGRAELFKKKLDIRYFLGAQFFFINYAKVSFELTQLSSTLTPTIWTRMKIAWKYKTQLKNVLLNKYSGGMQSLIDLQTMILLDMTKSSAKKLLAPSISLRTLFKKIRKWLGARKQP